ncbi:MAG: hypothetical protein HQL06_08835 [Nitrospirae bacterium]|nr:hypothetical protein [Nitrospirota bacterium]
MDNKHLSQREIVDFWVNKVLTQKSKVINREIVTNFINYYYSTRHLNNPEVIFAQTPIECFNLASSLRKPKNYYLEVDFKNILYKESVKALQVLKKRLSNIYMLVDLNFNRLVYRAMQKQLGKRRRYLQIIKGLGYWRNLDNYFDGASLAVSLGWFSLYDYDKKRYGEPTTELSERFREYLGAMPFYVKLLKSHAVVCLPPSEVHINGKRMLHNINGPSVVWGADTSEPFEIYALNGVLVDKEIVIKRPEEIAPELVLQEKNTQVRSEIIKKVGVSELLHILDTRSIDKFQDYELLEVVLPNTSSIAHYIKMVNPSTGAHHLECIPPWIDTCIEALNWRIGGLTWKPTQLT